MTSPFPFRGVIEGYYGTPWTHTQRVELLRWMHGQGLNTYVYAPKHDPYQRANWRLQYPDEQMTAFRKELDLATDIGVEWVPNISPGLPAYSPGTPVTGTTRSRDICFSCPEDREVLFSKLDPFFEAGARTLMVSFDDVRKKSSHPEDAAEYGTGDREYGSMNRELLNATYRRYQQRAGGDDFTLLTVLADYDGTGDTEYLRGIREDGGLDAGIEIMWTGTAVVSESIDPTDARAYADRVDRDKILIWDNYPTNDFTGGGDDEARRLFVGPYEGRPSDLHTATSGVLSNPMRQLQADKIPLGTIARYLNDPASYDPETAWREAITDLASSDEKLTDSVAAFAENSRSSELNRTESPRFVDHRDGFLTAWESGPFWVERRDVFLEELEREAAAPARIADSLPHLYAEANGFLDTLTDNARAARRAVRLLSAQRPSLHARIESKNGRSVRVTGSASPPSPTTVEDRFDSFTSAYAEALQTIDIMHGDRAEDYQQSVYADENRLDEFARQTVRRTVNWLSEAPAAVSGVVVTVDSEPVDIDDAGRFRTRLSRPVSDPIEVVATDDADGETGLHLHLT